MQYNSAYYDDFVELLDCDNQTANLLLDEFDLDHSDIGKYEWMNDQLTVYPDVVEYAIYELTDGWYHNHDLGGDFNGAPNPIDYIDLDALGVDLVDTGDSTCCQLLPNGKVVTTNYGW